MEAIENTPQAKLPHFPIMFFASTMGIGGLALCYRQLAQLFHWNELIGTLLMLLDTAIFAVLLFFYGMKLLRYPQAVKAELMHPIKINFFGAFTISAFLLSALWQCSILFYIVLAIQTIFTFYVITSWINRDYAITIANPVWFIPVAGNLIVPVVSPEKGLLSWYYFSVGLFFWAALFAMIFYRLIFHERLMEKFMPTLFILFAPPAIAFVGYTKMINSIDTLALVILNITVFFVGMAAFMFRNFLGLRFALSWWAFTFPLAAATLAFLRAYHLLLAPFFLYMSIFTFILLILFVLLVSQRTIRAILLGNICRPE